MDLSTRQPIDEPVTCQQDWQESSCRHAADVCRETLAYLISIEEDLPSYEAGQLQGMIGFLLLMLEARQ
jgi:hypothetical protein